MPLGNATDNDHKFMAQEAKTGYDEGGVPVGAMMVQDGEIIGRGRNRRVQEGNPVSHGETDCMKNAGRRSDYLQVTMYTTLSPCMMCAAILQFGIQRVVIGEDRKFHRQHRFLERTRRRSRVAQRPGLYRAHV